MKHEKAKVFGSRVGQRPQGDVVHGDGGGVRHHLRNGLASLPVEHAGERVEMHVRNRQGSNDRRVHGDFGPRSDDRVLRK